MPDIVDTYAAPVIELDFKREDGDEAVHVAAQKIGPPLAPGPELGADVVDHGDAKAPGNARHAEMKVRGVDDHDDVRPGSLQLFLDRAKKLHDSGQLGQDLGESHDGQGFGFKPGFDPFLAHGRSGHAQNPSVGTLLAQGPGQKLAVQVAGGFSRVHPDRGRVLHGVAIVSWAQNNKKPEALPCTVLWHRGGHA